jgi:hypothetical protein
MNKYLLLLPAFLLASAPAYGGKVPGAADFGLDPPQTVKQQPKHLKSGTVSINGHSHGAYVFIAINGLDETILCQIDSGASNVQIPANYMNSLWTSGKVTQADVIGTGNSHATLANGQTVATFEFFIHELKVIGVHKEQWVSVHHIAANSILPQRDNTGRPISYGGRCLLGYSFLQRFTSWTIDNENLTLTLQWYEYQETTAGSPN